ncbi:MAG: DUF6662 family protein [Ignavibacteria bacterium]
MSNLLADDRRFTYTYESSTLAKNVKDFEIWSTYRGGREYFYSRFDHRLEFEMGITNKLQTAFYLNFQNATFANAFTGDYETEFDWEGISTEFKYQVLNKYRDGIGFTPYLEFGLNTREVKIETKLIFDKQLSKSTTLAFNAGAEYEWGFNADPQRTSKTFELEFDLGLAYDITNNFSLGIEARSHSDFPNGKGLIHSALFIGPNISYRSDSWFFALTYLPQLPAIERSKDLPNNSSVLDDHEKNNARLILGFTL